MARRSVLFTPGDRREMLEGAPETDADVIVFDLEDGVAPSQKSEAREIVRAVLAADSFDPDAECLVRVNPIERTSARDGGGSVGGGSDGGGGGRPGYAVDVRALAPVADTIDGVVLPKVRSAADVRRLGGELRAHGLPRVAFALVETAVGVQAAPEIAAAGATDAVVLGTEDLAADVGSSPDSDRRESSHARQRVVTAAAAAEIDAIDTLWTDFEDEAGLQEDATDAAALGFDGKLAIHPSQVPVINDAFTPDLSECEWAQSVLTAREAAADSGAFAVDGEMIDAPLIARAERVADRARAAGIAIRREDG